MYAEPGIRDREGATMYGVVRSMGQGPGIGQG